MIDIVERLLGHPGEGMTVTEQFRNMVEQRHEAAAEIERLWGYVETLKTSQSSAVVNELNTEIARLHKDKLAWQDVAASYHDEIERLQTGWDLATKAVDENTSLKAEVERLQAAVKESLKLVTHSGHLLGEAHTEIERLRAQRVEWP